jgi:Ni/Fe-hydrogenase 1 B-type cytochrome subunit
MTHAQQFPGVFVYEWPVRLWHWVNACCLVVLTITGYLIAHPLPTVAGEASAHFLTGTIRTIHFATAYVFAIGLLARLYWACVGNSHARELFLPPLYRPSWWWNLGKVMAWYGFLRKEPIKTEGHNPLAQATMFFMFVLGSLFMMFTGFALYSEGQGRGSLFAMLFGWVIPALGQSQDVHSLHHLGMWFLVCFTIVHVYAAIREDVMSRQTMITTMTNGWRFFKDERP